MPTLNFIEKLIHWSQLGDHDDTKKKHHLTDFQKETLIKLSKILENDVLIKKELLEIISKLSILQSSINNLTAHLNDAELTAQQVKSVIAIQKIVNKLDSDVPN